MNKPQKLSLKNLSWYTFSLYHDSPFRIVVGIGENPSTKKTECLVPKKEILKLQKYEEKMNNNQNKGFEYHKVKKVLEEKHEIRVKPWKVKDIMKKDLDMRYKKVKPVSILANSAKNWY